MRMFSPIAALLDRPVRMNARGTLGSRSMTMVSKPLSDFGVRCGTAGGRPPLDIQGPLQGGEYYLDTTESSQFLTGLLIALPLAGKDSLIRTERPVSRGYLDLTIETCAAFGVTIERDCEYSSFSIKGNQRYLPATFTVEGDWSGAAFLVAAASLAADSAGVELKGLNGASSQPDRAILTAVGKAGTPMQFMEDGSLKLWRGARRNFSFDATDCPDLFPPLAALAAGCTGTTELKGLHRLRNKESDRALSLCTLLGNLGVKSRIEGDSLFIDGGMVRSGTVDSFGDHRIAMAAAIAALAADGPVTIGGAECVAKSWPDFFQCLNALRR